VPSEPGHPKHERPLGMLKVLPLAWRMFGSCGGKMKVSRRTFVKYTAGSTLLTAVRL
jgi:hypothetical protein